MSRLFALTWDALVCAIAACPLVLLAVPPAYAYVDPSVMTYTIQAVAGVAVALSAVLGVALRRSRKVIFRIFKIDENANKVVEEPVIAIDSHSPDATAQHLEAEVVAKHDAAFLDRGPAPKRLNWPRRFIRALLCCAFLVLTVFIMGPLEIVAGSGDSLNFGYLDAAPYVMNSGLVLILVLALLLSLVRGRFFDVLLTLVASLGICAYVQALFLNVSLPIADGNALSLENYKTLTVISSIVWLAIIIGFLVLNAQKKQICRTLALTLSACLILVQSVSLFSITLDEQQKAESGTVAFVQTAQGLYDVSKNDNVIVFVLDFFDTRVLEEILENNPQTLAEFTGFTYFRNSTGSLIPTRYGIPYLLTGEMPHSEDTYYSYTFNRYKRSSFLDDIAKAGYDIGIYSDSVQNDEPSAIASNYVASTSLEIDAPALVSILDKIALYRDLPWLLKPLFWFYTDEVNRAAISDAQNPYVMDDIEYAKSLRADGLSLNDNDKVFRFIHLLGAHYPYVMDADGNAVKGQTNIQTQGHGSLMIVSDYLRELKRLGLYDNATIIVTSDHGDWYLTDQALEEPTSPILLAKPAENAKQAAQPLKTSDVPTGHLDFQATIIDAIGGETAKYGSTFFEIQPGSRPRYYWMTESDGANDTFLREYEINGHVLEFDSWKLTGKNIDNLQ